MEPACVAACVAKARFFGDFDVRMAFHFSGGYLLLSRLDPKQYRLIMSRIEVDYVYQAKDRIVSESDLPEERLQHEIIEPLREQEAVTIRMESRIQSSDC